MKYINYILESRYFKALILLVLSGVIFASLGSYSEYDSSINVVSDLETRNYLGNFGAYFADILYQYFGITAWFIPVSAIILAVNIILFEDIRNIRFRFLLSIVASFSAGFLLYHLFSVNDFGFYRYFDKEVDNMEYEFRLVFDVIILFVASFTIFFSLGIKSEHYSKFFKFLYLFLYNLISSIFASSEEDISVSKVKSVKKETKAASSKSNFNTKTYEDTDENNSSTIPTRIDDDFELPSLDLLELDKKTNVLHESEQELEAKAEELLNVLKDFGVKGNIIEINQGPVVTLFEFEPAAGTKSSRVISLSDDIARTMCTVSARIAVIPGRNVLGIELPNKEREFFRLRELLESGYYNDEKINLPIVLGKDLGGKTYVVDLAKMPHLLVAGTTGSGKSVAINTMIISLLYRHTPKTCRFIMIDPKMLELSVYDNIPHLLTPVVTDPGKAVVALKWAVKEMENRYRLMSNLGVRNIYGYNERIRKAIASGEEITKKVQTGFEPDTGRPIYENVPVEMEELPFIVIIVDEMADLMLVAGKDIESSIQRLAQMARAAGIHLIMATQRPSVDVITGVIKANFPSRISFKVTSKIDSRTILGEQGSEQLLGMGDMLYMGTSSGIRRVHGPFVDDSEVEQISSFLKSQGDPEYVTSVTVSDEEDNGMDNAQLDLDDNSDEGLYRKAVAIVKRDRKASTSYVQRQLRIGYNRAAIIIERMEEEGILSEPGHSGKREILIDED